jgi:hypothetical protein
VGADVLEWWRTHESRYPRVARAAKIFLAIPATTAPSERLFSLAGGMLNKKRTRMAPEMVEVLAVLQSAYSAE